MTTFRSARNAACRIRNRIRSVGHRLMGRHRDEINPSRPEPRPVPRPRSEDRNSLGSTDTTAYPLPPDGHTFNARTGVLSNAIQNILSDILDNFHDSGDGGPVHMFAFQMFENGETIPRNVITRERLLEHGFPILISEMYPS